mmetsp:Transcript_83142/g.269160  ORF Transcript_83142/g.269160 Transcript_83142/m.269160 type:complete len:161 (+) Transcript_83142:2673-3155(+)
MQLSWPHPNERLPRHLCSPLPHLGALLPRQPPTLLSRPVTSRPVSTVRAQCLRELPLQQPPEVASPRRRRKLLERTTLTRRRRARQNGCVSSRRAALPEALEDDTPVLSRLRNCFWMSHIGLTTRFGGPTNSRNDSSGISRRCRWPVRHVGSWQPIKERI